MALTFNHQTNEISNDGVITVGGVAVGGDNTPYWYGNTAVFAGGSSGATKYNVMQSVTISTTGNATDFGDLTVARERLAGCSNGDRGTYGGGLGGSATNTIDYITFATSGNAIDFGDLTVARYGLSSCSDGSRGLFFGGLTSALNN